MAHLPELHLILMRMGARLTRHFALEMMPCSVYFSYVIEITRVRVLLGRAKQTSVAPQHTVGAHSAESTGMQCIAS